ncbi:hypothetical protein JCGZ_20270 [Jatropha curcas]|uniref:Uncharacterized protein n=1 Tax=Jatropha curcas TaxID=180498 RepID=A0A067JX23_JATCU|nr:hypothetical protein JCGZ_20270 [Jatropha curcas]
MSSSGDDDVQVLHDQSRYEKFKDTDSGVGEVKGKKENVRTANAPSDINEGELLDICFMYSIAPEYKFIRPSGNMRVIEPLDEDSIMIITISELHPNGLRFLYAIDALARQDGYTLTARAVRGLYHFSVRPNEDHCFLQTKKDCNAKGLAAVNLRQVIAVGYPVCSPSGPMRPNPSPTDALKSAKAAMREQEAWHKANIDAHDAELERLKEEN